jgi:hypothetical protein
MRKRWKIPGAISLLVLGYVRGLVDVIGEVQTVNELPILKWVIHPYFSFAATSAAIILGAWAYYDIRVKKAHAGFIGAPENKRSYKKQAIVGAIILLVVFTVAPLFYGYLRSNSLPKGTSPTSLSAPPTKAPEASATAPKGISKSTQKAYASQPSRPSEKLKIEAPVTQQSSGACSPNQIGNSNVNNCGPPPLSFSAIWEQSSDAQSTCTGITTKVRITPNQAVSAPMDLAFDVNTPVIVAPNVLIENSGSTELDGSRWGRHPMVKLGTGITPANAAIITICTIQPIFQVSGVRIEGR